MDQDNSNQQKNNQQNNDLLPEKIQGQQEKLTDIDIAKNTLNFEEKVEEGQQENEEKEEVKREPGKRKKKKNGSNERMSRNPQPQPQPQYNFLQDLQQMLQRAVQLQQQQRLQQEQKKRIIKQELEKQLRFAEARQELEIKRRVEIAKTQQECCGCGAYKYCLWITVVFLLFVASKISIGYYNKEFKDQMSRSLPTDTNYYQLFNIHPNATHRQLQLRFKELKRQNDPDLHPNCINCDQIYLKILEAWEVLGSPVRRQQYTKNLELIKAMNQVKPHSTKLTPQNYKTLIQDSQDHWIVLVYESSDLYDSAMLKMWELTSQQYNGLVRFGNVDVSSQKDMFSFLPYRFQIYPSVYYHYQGQYVLCQVNLSRISQSINSVKKCIRQPYQQYFFQRISSIKQVAPPLPGSKIPIIISSNVVLSTRHKILNHQLSDKFNFYLLDQNSLIKDLVATVRADGSRSEIHLKLGKQQKQENFRKYSNFLQSLIIQKTQTCKIIQLCEFNACFILLEGDQFTQKVMPKQGSEKCYPIYKATDKYKLDAAIDQVQQRIKSTTHYQIGLYKKGQIKLGFLDQSGKITLQAKTSFSELNHICRQDINIKDDQL